MAKKILSKINISEISAVTRPAQAGALAVIMKSAGGVTETPNEEIRKRGDLVDVLTDVTDGHQHGIRVSPSEEGLYLWVDYAECTSDDDYGHDHSISVNAEGDYIIAMNKGHTHTLDSELLKAAIMNSYFNKSESANGGVFVNKEGLLMPALEKTAEHVAAESKVAELISTLAKANQLASMTEVQKTHYGTLTGSEADAFLAKSDEDRVSVIAEINKADPVVYTAIDGTEFHKSDDARYVAMAKKSDANDAEIAKTRAINSKLEFEKRADDELSFMPGDLATRAAIVKAIDGIANDELRKSAQASISAKNTEMSKSFGEGRVTGHSDTAISKGETVDANAQLDTLSKAYATEHSVNYFEAYETVSNANPALLELAAR